MAFEITLISSEGEQSQFCSNGELSVLRAMEIAAVSGIPVGCRGGGCGVCRVRIDKGEVVKKVMSRKHISEADEAAGEALACRIYAASDLTITQLPVVVRGSKAITATPWAFAQSASEHTNKVSQ